jgi:transposase
MYIQWNKVGKNKNYPKAILRQSYRENGKSKKRTIANLGKCSTEEIKAMELALKHKGDLSVLVDIKEEIIAKQGLSFGANFVIFELIKRLGMEKALRSLGDTKQAKLAIWQIIARLVNQGSRLSTVRMARDEAADEIIHFESSFNENDLYKNLTWLGNHQEAIEDKLFALHNDQERPSLYLYDVTSSYLEGVCNELAEWGYNRDRKKGKKQIVIGLLCDSTGIPLSVEVFSGNTADTATFKNQIAKVCKRFNCKKVTFVGDKGMIKSTQIEDLQKSDFHYITSITKPQIEKLVKDEVFQLELFSDHLVEIEHQGVRYILRRNPLRKAEIEQNKREKQSAIEKLIKEQNEYLENHPKAKVETALRKITSKIERLKLKTWFSVKAQGRIVSAIINHQAKEEQARFDGCYCLKTDLASDIASTQVVHDRYKDLAKVESAFKTMKTSHLEIRPLYLVKEENTKGHILICMLAYILEQSLRKAWQDLDLTVKEGIKRLRTLCTTEIEVKKSKTSFNQITKPNKRIDEILKRLDIKIPKVLPKRKVNVDTRVKLKQSS